MPCVNGILAAKTRYVDFVYFHKITDQNIPKTLNSKLHRNMESLNYALVALVAIDGMAMAIPSHAMARGIACSYHILYSTNTGLQKQKVELSVTRSQWKNTNNI